MSGHASSQLQNRKDPRNQTQELEKMQKRVEQTMQLRRKKEETREMTTRKGGETAASGSRNLEFTRALHTHGWRVGDLGINYEDMGNKLSLIKSHPVIWHRKPTQGTEDACGEH